MPHVCICGHKVGQSLAHFLHCDGDQLTDVGSHCAYPLDSFLQVRNIKMWCEGNDVHVV